MEKSDRITTRVLGIISQIVLKEKSTLDMKARIEDICKDSIQVFSLILALEKEFGKKAEYDDLVNIETVGDIVAYIKKNV